MEKTGNCISGVQGGSVCDQTEQGGQEKGPPPFLALQKERKQKRDALTRGGPIGSPQRTHWQLRSYQMFCTAANTGFFSPPDKGSPIQTSIPPCSFIFDEQGCLLAARNKSSHALHFCASPSLFCSLNDSYYGRTVGCKAQLGHIQSPNYSIDGVCGFKIN